METNKALNTCYTFPLWRMCLHSIISLHVSTPPFSKLWYGPVWRTNWSGIFHLEWHKSIPYVYYCAFFYTKASQHLYKNYFHVVACLIHYYGFQCRWEDSLNSASGGRSVQRTNSFTPTSSSGISGGYGRGGRVASHATAGTFVSATGDQVSGRKCFVCGDPSHFANVCPNRG